MVNSTDASSPKISTFYKIKDGSIFLGILYALSLLIMLPVYLKFHDNYISLSGFLLISLLAVVIIHILINWLYYFIISVPAIASVILFIIGWVIYVLTPLSELLLRVILDTISIIIPFSQFDPSQFTFIDPFYDFIDRLALFLITLSAIFWWFVKKGENIKYKALAIYVVFIAFLGAILGISNMTITFYFLFIWYLIFLKIKGIEEINDIKYSTTLFKIAATLIVLSGVSGVEIVNSGVSASHLLFSSNPNSEVWYNFTSIYPKLLGILAIFGIWKPKVIQKIMPTPIKTLITYLESKGKTFIKVI